MKGMIARSVYISPTDWYKAFDMWWSDWKNTLEIASFFGVHESVIYNGMNRLKIQSENDK
jgi:hypothetical protein